MRTVADRNRRRRWDQPPPPSTTGGVERAVFELLRLAIGTGSRNVPIGDRWHPRRSVDMLFKMGSARVVVEYDAAYFHPSHGDDFDRSRQALDVLGVSQVIRIRESPLETRGFDGFVHAMGVPRSPDPQLCAAAVLLHMEHCYLLDLATGQDWRGEPMPRTQVRLAVARFGADAVSAGCSACRKLLGQFAQWYGW